MWPTGYVLLWIEEVLHSLENRETQTMSQHNSLSKCRAVGLLNEAFL